MNIDREDIRKIIKGERREKESSNIKNLINLLMEKKSLA